MIEDPQKIARILSMPMDTPVTITLRLDQLLLYRSSLNGQMIHAEEIDKVSGIHPGVLFSGYQGQLNALEEQLELALLTPTEEKP